MKTVVVTGVGRHLGAHVAGRLAATPGIGRVIGLDAGPPVVDLDARVETVRADLRTPAIADVVADADAVVHLALVTSSQGYAGGRAVMKEQNVIGTMQLLAACQRAPKVRKLVVRSSTAAYGASFQDPAVFTEETEPREVPRGGYARDILDIEDYVRGFRRRRPDVAATVLRFVPLVGTTDTRLTRYFARPVVPTVLGRDPRLQFVHLDDAQEILHRSVVEDHPGVFNVAGPGVLLLSQALRRAGRIGVPVPESALSGAASLWPGVSIDQVDLFVHGRVVDVSRLVKEYGYTPRSTAVAFDDFVRAHQLDAPLGRDRVSILEQSILDGIRRVRHGRVS